MTFLKDLGEVDTLKSQLSDLNSEIATEKAAAKKSAAQKAAEPRDVE